MTTPALTPADVEANIADAKHAEAVYCPGCRQAVFVFRCWPGEGGRPYRDAFIKGVASLERQVGYAAFGFWITPSPGEVSQDDDVVDAQAHTEVWRGDGTLFAASTWDQVVDHVLYTFHSCPEKRSHLNSR